jgi:S-(hydroxymethyl)glutathione dehydrogenase/alcohol dehydrogenase
MSINPYDDESGVERPGQPVSRRDLFKTGAAAVVGGAASVLGGGTAFAQAPAVQTSSTGKNMAGTKFRAYVRHADFKSTTVETVTLLPIQPRQVVIRLEAAQACYTIVNALAPVPPAPPAPPAPGAPPAAPPNPAARNAAIVGHGGVGIVEQVGSMVKRVEVGDRVIVPVTAQCGECYNCLHGKADRCQSGVNRPLLPMATLADGSPVNGNLGAFAELMVAWEEQTVPIFSKHNAVELSLLSCVATTGLGMAMMRVPVEAGSHVVIFGAGPVGLAAIQGARIMAASKIIAVEPIAYRRALATKVGATAVLDPNVDAANLVQKLRTMTTGETDRAFAGGRGPAADGPDFIIEAVGGDRFPPKTAEKSPDPTGAGVLQQAWQLCPPGGWIRTCGVGHPAGTTVTFPAGAWSNGTKQQAGGNFAGVNTKRDIPMFVRLIEAGQFDAKSMVGKTYKIDQAREALQAAADRTSISSVMTFT